MAGLEHQYAVAGRQRVDERGLPRAGAGGRVGHDRASRLEHFMETLEDLVREARELGAAVIDRRPVDRPQHPIRHVGGAGDLQEVAAGWVRVELEHRSLRRRLRYGSTVAAMPRLS